MKNVETFLKNKKYIFDIGCGDKGSFWWRYIEPKAKIVGIEINFFPDKLPNFATVYKFDANLLNKISNQTIVPKLNCGIKKIIHGQFVNEKVFWINHFDMVVANHVLEHVQSPESVIQGIAKIIKKDGIVYCCFPDGKNFTDIFYHLIHPDGGGHIQKLSKEKVKKWFNKYEFKLISNSPWPDDWIWLEKFYDFRSRGIKYINQKEITYLANVFRKELTLEKGYFYGWEMVFRKL